jgi:hypothetical protein
MATNWKSAAAKNRSLPASQDNETSRRQRQTTRLALLKKDCSAGLERVVAIQNREDDTLRLRAQVLTKCS